MHHLPVNILDFLRERKLTTCLKDMGLTMWIYRQIEESGIEHIKKMKEELSTTVIVIAGQPNMVDVEKKYREEIIYLNYLVETYQN